MKIRTLGGLIGLSALASTFVSCAQAKVVCLVGHAGSQIGYAVTYTAKPSASGCGSMVEHTPGVTLDQLKGDIVGFETYHPVVTTADGADPDFTKTTVALQADSLGVLRLDKEAKDAADASDGKAYAIGSFVNAEPDADNFCPVKDIQPAELSFPEVAEAKDDMGEVVQAAEDPVDVKYEWSNLKLYVTAAAPGTQFSGDLKYTQNGCTVEYHAVGLWPAVDCGVYDDDTGDLVDLNPDACLAEADPAKGRATGSGINPDFPTACTAIRDKASELYPAMALCTLKGEPPAFTTKTR
jgi:hypothetical protein